MLALTMQKAFVRYEHACSEAHLPDEETELRTHDLLGTNRLAT